MNTQVLSSFLPAPLPATAAISGAAPTAAAVQKALGRLVLDTLTRLGTLDTTDRGEVHAALNLLHRLLAVLADPAPRLRELAAALSTEGATARASVAAALYRELAAFGASRLGLAAPSLLDD